MTDASDPGLYARWQERRRVRRAEEQNQSGMDYLMSVPQRWIHVYIPLSIITFVLSPSSTCSV